MLSECKIQIMMDKKAWNLNFFVFLCYKTAPLALYKKEHAVKMSKNLTFVDRWSLIAAYKKLQAMVRLRSLSNAEEDALNDAFLQLWVGKYRPKGEAEAGKLLWQSMRHRQISLWRTGTRHPKRPLAEVQIAEPPPEEEAAEDTYQQIWELIKTQLTPLQQDILQRHDINDETYSMIAERLGMQEAAVRMQLSRARKKIREIYKQKRK